MVNLKVIENIIKNMVIDMKEIGKMVKEKVKVFVIILMESFGIISYKSGNKYEGEWKEGKKMGKEFI